MWTIKKIVDKVWKKLKVLGTTHREKIILSRRDIVIQTNLKL